MGNPSPKQPQDPKTRIRLALKQAKYKKFICEEAEAALREIAMMVAEDPDVPEQVKNAAQERYEAFGEHRDELVERQLAECEWLVRGGSEI